MNFDQRVFTALTLVCSWAASIVPELLADQDDRTDRRPGLAYVFFDDPGLIRPGSHDLDKGIKSHDIPTAIKSHGVEPAIDLDISGVDGFSKLWVGQIHFPNDGKVTFVAEADDGLRLIIDGRVIVDGWSPTGNREGSIIVSKGQPLSIRAEYFHTGRRAFFRLNWHWHGEPPMPVPSHLFSQGRDDRKLVRHVAEGKARVLPGTAAWTYSVPRGDEEFRSSIYKPDDATRSRTNELIRLGIGPNLFIDDFLIESSANLKRRVNRPQRDDGIGNPIITGKEDHCVAPYMTILRDEQTGRFRIWYNIYKEKYRDGSARFATMESKDGVHWIRPHRVIEDPDHINFGVSVIDEGPAASPISERFKLAWWNDGGLKLAVSPDGFDWNLWKSHPLLYHNHDINNIFFDRNRKNFVATISVYTTGPTWKGTRRVTMQSASTDLQNWSEPRYVLTPDDHVDEGETQFYCMQGHLIRGGLWIGLVKVLRDDLRASGTPEGAIGVGYTTLAWTRDGINWVRDLEPFFESDPDVEAWDHAHAWMDYQLPVGDEIFIYYGGYKHGHKMDRWEGRQIGLVRMLRDRYVARVAGEKEGWLRTPPLVLTASQMSLNANVNGELRVRVLNKDGTPMPGFDFHDSDPVTGDSLEHQVQWNGKTTLPINLPVRIEFRLRNAQIYGFDLSK